MKIKPFTKKCLVISFLLFAQGVCAIPLQLDINLFDGGDFGVRFSQFNAPEGILDVNYNNGPALQKGEQVQQGFTLLDGSLLVQASSSDITGLRARLGIRYQEQALERLGIRSADLRLMRFDIRANTWVRARVLLRDIRARIGARFLDGVEGRISRANFSLGNFGVDSERNLVWGVMDTDGRYAIGAIDVPEPKTLSLLLLALGGLLLVRKRSHAKPLS